MQTLAEIRSMLSERGLAPRKRLGQNFLTDHNLIRKLVDTSGVGAGDLVLEVGPGTGTLTDELLARGASVVASELDAGLAELLRDRFAGSDGFTLIEGDCLDGSRRVAPAILGALAGRRYTLVANLPYGAATPLMLVLLTDPGCRGQFVTIQREVADRLLAGPGSKAYGSVSVAMQVLARVERIATLPPGCFWPQPEVTSAMVSIVPAEPPLGLEAAGFLAFCQRVFVGRRKQLGTVLGDGDWPEGVSRRDRAESLSPAQVVELWTRRGEAVG